MTDSQYIPSRIFRWVLALTLVLNLVLAAPPQAARAATMVVTNANDDGEGSLRQAIAGAQPGDTIVFADDYTIYLNTMLEVYTTVTIDGSGHAVKISGDSGGDGTPNTSVFYIDVSAIVTLTHLSVVSGTTPSYGGGIMNLGTLTVQNSTISGNSGYWGGGIFSFGTLVVRNSTFSGNSANSGGGICNNQTLTVQNSTFSGNSANSGGGIHNDSGAMTLSNTLIANSPSGGDCRNSDANSANDHNLIEDTGNNACGMVNGANGNIVGVDPLLAPLGSYGGATQTFSLLPGSPAINAGNSAACPADDQRGVARPQGPGCDIGAIESRGFALAVAGGSGQSTPAGTRFPNPLELAVSSSFGEPVDGGWAAFTGPAGGAGIEPAVYTATIGNGGVVTQVVKSNGVMGSYTVSANTIGGLVAAGFGLTNLAPNMVVMGNGIVITDGDTTPAPADHTDFGSVAIGGAITRTFTISNSGWLTLTINSLSLSGAGAGVFAFSGLTTPVTLSKNDTAAFQVRFEPTTVGTHLATVAIAISTDDGDQNTYDFAIQGRCLCVDQIQVVNANDSGPGSLRWTIDSVCGGGTVDFAGGYTIYLDSQLELTKTLTIDGNGHTVTVSGDSGGDGTPNVRVFYMSSGGVVTLTHLNIVSGTISGNDGGGIYNQGGMLVVQNSTLSGNQAGLSGGGIYNTGVLTVQNSTFSGNLAKWGGSLFNNAGALMVQNSTLSGNSASDSGGGFYNQSSSTATVQNSTLSGNAAPSGGGLYNNNGALHLYNTVIADSPSGGDCSGNVTTNDHNLIEGNGAACGLTNGAGGSIIGADPLLAPLGDYGGAMPTLALLPGSPALDAGDNGACLAADQRGVARPQGGACDIGAFESHGFILTYAGGSDQTAVGYTPFPDPLGLTVGNSYGEPLDGGQVILTGPSDGAGLYPTVYTATVAGGAVSQTVWANATVGSYTVLADMRGNLGAVVSFTLTNLAPKMTVLGNGRIILDGDAVPSPDDDTDFGSLDVGGVVTHTFTISNCSSTTGLTITGLSLSGADAGDFALSGLTTPVTLPPTGTVPFQVRFAPTAVGTRSATVVISNDGGPESDYDFAIQSTDVCGHRVSVTNANDDGPGSLRYALDRVCDGGTVDFTGSYTIYLDSQLELTKSLTIDGSGHTITLSGDSGGDGSPNVRVFYISSSGVVTLTHLAIVSAAYGGVYSLGALTVRNCTFSGNSYGAGGGVTNLGAAIVQTSIFSGNHATTNYGGGIANYGTATVQDCIFSGNTARSGGGGIYIASSGRITVQNSIVSGNQAVGLGTYGGGIFNADGTLTLRNSTLSGNSAGNGGGMYSYGPATVQYSIFSDNVSGAHGGGIFSDETASIQNSTFSGNVAHEDGGGIYNHHAMTVWNSTFSGNSADFQGGGIYNTWQSELPGYLWLAVQNSTFSGNSANQGGGGIYAAYGSRLNLYNTLVANSSRGGDCQKHNALELRFTSNLIEGNGNACDLVNGVDGNIIGVDPLLGPLADNGGPLAGLGQAILTHALLPGSPALDVAAGGLPTDQRGVARPQGLGYDIGAFEAQSFLSLAKRVTPALDVPYHGVVTYTIVLSNSGAISDTAVILTDTLPVGVAFGEWLENPGAVAAGNAITWTGVLTTQTVLTFTFTAVHTGDYGDAVTNTASFSGTAQIGHAAATFSVVPTYTLTIRLDGSGMGAVNSNPSGIACGELCAADYVSGTVVTLTAAPLVSSTFAGWSGAVTTTANPITVTLDVDKTVTATFTLKSYVITPTAGVGGSIAPSAPQNVAYGGDVAFAIAPENGYHIADIWVDGSPVGAVASYVFENVVADHTISATFALNEYTLAVGVLGQGAVTRVPSRTTYLHGQVVTLTATPEEAWYFGGWSGDLTTASPTEHLTMDGNKAVTATFTQAPPVTHTLTIAAAGNGSGEVTPTVGAHVYLSGTLVTLGATSNPGSVFAGWSGDPGCAAGQVTLDADKTCTAVFDLIPATYALTFDVVGNGAVAIDPPGGVYNAGTPVTLTATPDGGWYFGGWSGDLNTVDAVEHLTMDGNKAVTATFTEQPPVTHTLTIAIAGDGSGVVTPTVGTHVYISGTLVTLGATPNPGSSFAGWSGDGCAGGQVTLDADRVCTATFNLAGDQHFIYLPLAVRQ